MENVNENFSKHWKICFTFRAMKIDMKEIGARIRRIRDEKGLTQEEFGKLIGVQGAAVSKYEKGDIDPGTAGIVRIAETGGVAIDWLITGKGPPPSPAKMTDEDILVLALTSKPAADKYREKVKEEVREELGRYEQDRRQVRLSDEERKLVENYRVASGKIRKAAYNMLEDDAQESRTDAGGGSGSTAQGCG